MSTESTIQRISAFRDLMAKAGIKNLRLYVNGNNLFMWTKMPDDCERGSSGDGVYPSFKRFNVGIDLSF